MLLPAGNPISRAILGPILIEQACSLMILPGQEATSGIGWLSTKDRSFSSYFKFYKNNRDQTSGLPDDMSILDYLNQLQMHPDIDGLLSRSTLPISRSWKVFVLR